jgi:hypothetical protein
LVGKSEKTIRNLLAKCSADTVNGSIGFEALSKPLKPFAGIDFSGGDKISDIVVWAIVNHYASATSRAFQMAANWLGISQFYSDN